MNVAVYGSSQPEEGSQQYVDARLLGDMLARRGHTVLTGGYAGTMEAVSRGAAEAGGHVVGVTCDGIAHWYGRAANPWVSEERRQTTLIQRLRVLIEDSDAAMALPGGPGTLTEIALTWNLMIVGTLVRRPLILIGEGWLNVWDTFDQYLGDYTQHESRALLTFASGPADAVEVLESSRTFSSAKVAGGPA